MKKNLQIHLPFDDLFCVQLLPLSVFYPSSKFLQAPLSISTKIRYFWNIYLPIHYPHRLLLIQLDPLYIGSHFLMAIL